MQPELEIGPMLMGLAGGLALFLFGMEQMADALKALAGERLKFVLTRLTTNRLSGVFTGAFVTAIIQSSSITTVLTVGFISAGVLSLSQAVYIIFGANIGSTVTAQIIAFKVTKFSLPMIAVGFALLFAGRSDRLRQNGAMIMGLGLLFFGMHLMSEAMQPLRTYTPFIDLMAHMETPLLGILVAAFFTALVQSSAVTTGIVITLAGQGLITLPAGIALAFGANIGTCATALLASIGKNPEAVRASVVHVLFNVFGVLLWVFFIDYLALLVIWISPSGSLSGSEKLAAETPRQIANAHTIFNVVNTLVFLPAAGLFARMAERLVADEAPVEAIPENARQWTQLHLDPALLAVPALALSQVHSEIRRMAFAVRHVLVEIAPAFVENDNQAANRILERESQIHFLEDQISEYLVSISSTNLSDDLAAETVRLLNITKDLERIGNLVELNLVGLLEQKTKSKALFSLEGQQELLEYHRRLVANFDQALEAVDQEDAELARQVMQTKAQLVDLEWQYRKAHYNRLSQARAESLETSHIHLELIDQLRRIDSYIESIARTIAEKDAPPTITTEQW
jgi:phosphate:Na+ symporter